MVKKLVEKWIPHHSQSFTYKTYPIESCPDSPDQFMLRMHDECEITLLEGCSGKRFVGNSIENFSDGDLFLIGPRLQHGIQVDEGCMGTGITIHFQSGSFGQHFFQMPECSPIRQLLSDANMGVAFSQASTEVAKEHLARIRQSTGFARILAFFSLLDYLACSAERRKLSSRVFAPVVNQKDYDTVNLAYQFIISRFRDENITLDDISNHLNMSSATFCRYFKKHFRKTFTSFLNEIRVGHACKLLQDTDRSIAEIAYSSGYRQLTHFNRQFKRIVGRTPKQYRSELAYQRA